MFGIVQSVRRQFQSLERIHVPDRLGNCVQPITVEFKDFQPCKGIEESIGTLPGQFYARQVQRADMLERCRQLRQIAQLQAIEIQHGIGNTVRTDQPLAPALQDAQGTQSANAGRCHPARSLSSTGKQPAIQLACKRVKGLFPSGKALADLRVGCPTLAHLFQRLGGLLIDKRRVQPLQALCQDPESFSRRDLW
ncbi:hypothetical protein D3C72_649790 [compost metagenome]